MTRQALILLFYLALPACGSKGGVLKDSTEDSSDSADSRDSSEDSSDSSDSQDSNDSAEDTDPEGGPTAIATVDPITGIIPFGITLSGADSLAGDEPIERFTWLLSDGSELEGATIEATLLSQGDHCFTLTVMDHEGRSDTDIVEVQAECPAFEEAAVAGIMSWGEVSGLAAASFGGTLWGHSDAQGRTASFQAISDSAGLLGTFLLSGVSNTDWEDIARGPGPLEGTQYLYIADTGDNNETRESVSVLRFAEPGHTAGGTLSEVERFEFSYPGGARDAETLLVDPLSGDLFLVERDRSGHGDSGIYMAEAPLESGSSIELVEVGRLSFGVDPLPGDTDVTGGDVSPDGRIVAVRTHDHVWLFARDPAEPLASAFENPVCDAPLVDEPKGEAIAFAADGSGYFTGGEGNDEPLHWFAAR